MTIIYAAYQNTQFKLQIEYVLDLILSIYGVDYWIADYSCLTNLRRSHQSILISYGEQKPKSILKHHIHIYSAELFGEKYLRLDSMPRTPLKEYDGLPLIFSGCGKFNDSVRRSQNLIETNIDIVASSFFVLSRYEEAVLERKDRFGRFPATESLAYKERFLRRPIVNDYVELLWSWIESFNLGFERKNLWRYRNFTVCLTHDVDTVRKFGVYPPVGAIKSLILKRGKPKKAFDEIVGYVKVNLGLEEDPCRDSFDRMIQLEKKYGFVSSFYFMGGRGVEKYDNRYSINSPSVVSLIKSLKSKGFEIGLHGSFHSYNSLEMLQCEKNRLQRITGSNIVGGRQHYLRWKTPDTWRILEKAGLKYDTTLGFADQEGFRCGTCLPYKPFDILENRVLNIWELPLTVMDGSLFDYQGLSPEEGFQRIKGLIDTVKKYSGVFVLLWHNSSFDESRLPGWSRVYERTLRHVAKQNVFNATANGIIDWWEKGKLVRRDR